VAKVPPQFGGKITNLQALNQTDQTHLYSSSHVLTVIDRLFDVYLYFWISTILMRKEHD